MILEETILQLFPDFLQQIFHKLSDTFADLEEIRVGANRPLIVFVKGKEYFVSSSGSLQKEEQNSLYLKEEEMEQLIHHICKYSIYAYEDEIRGGFITVAGGHRVGVAGQVVLEDDIRIRTIKYITYINIRISHQIIGVADKVLGHLYQNNSCLNTLIISPPGCGKTTLLRDIIRQVSYGNQYATGKRVGVVDERSEIAGSYKGVAQNDVGIRTDVMDRCPKHIGMMMMIRSMAPEMIAVDEIGSERDLEALRVIRACGCKVIATIHGSDMEDIQNSSFGRKILEETIFERFIILERKNGRCQIKYIVRQEGG